MCEGVRSSLLASRPLRETNVTISAVIASCDEADVIETCLQSVVQWVDEIVFIDMHSTDGTGEIARRYGARLIEHERVPYVELVRDGALQEALGGWIFALDPDGFLDAALALELRRLAESCEYDVVLIQLRAMAFGRFLTAPGLAEPPIPRFFGADTVRWGTDIHALPDLSDLRCYAVLGSDPTLTLGIIHGVPLPPARRRRIGMRARMRNIGMLKGSGFLR